MKDIDILTQRLNKAQHDYENQLMQSDQLAGENSQKGIELKLKEEEIGNLKADIARVNKLREGLNRKLRMMEEQKIEVESSRESLRQHIASLERGTSRISRSSHNTEHVFVFYLQRCNHRESNLISTRKLMMTWLGRETFSARCVA